MQKHTHKEPWTFLTPELVGILCLLFFIAGVLAWQLNDGTPIAPIQFSHSVSNEERLSNLGAIEASLEGTVKEIKALSSGPELNQ